MEQVVCIIGSLCLLCSSHVPSGPYRPFRPLQALQAQANAVQTPLLCSSNTSDMRFRVWHQLSYNSESRSNTKRFCNRVLSLCRFDIPSCYRLVNCAFVLDFPYTLTQTLLFSICICIHLADRQLFCSNYFNNANITKSIMAAMSRTLRAIPPFLVFPTCIESALIISPWSRFPISIASLDLPVPVAPKITTKDGTIALRKARCTFRVEAAMMLPAQCTADDCAHALLAQ